VNFLGSLKKKKKLNPVAEVTIYYVTSKSAFSEVVPVSYSHFYVYDKRRYLHIDMLVFMSIPVFLPICNNK